MKLKFIFLSLGFVFIASCKNEVSDKDANKVSVTESSVESQIAEGQQRYEGEFVFLVDAAVLTSRNTNYAIEIDSMMYELDRVAKALKQDEYDAVNVIIHGTEKLNPMREETGEGWEKMITIKKIIEVSPANNSQVIRTGASVAPQNKENI